MRYLFLTWESNVEISSSNFRATISIASPTLRIDKLVPKEFQRINAWISLISAYSARFQRDPTSVGCTASVSVSVYSTRFQKTCRKTVKIFSIKLSKTTSTSLKGKIRKVWTKSTKEVMAHVI